MNKLHIWVRYKNTEWSIEETNPVVYVDHDGRTKVDEDYLSELQDGWYDVIGSKIPNFDWDDYDMGFDLFVDLPEFTFGGIE